MRAQERLREGGWSWALMRAQERLREGGWSWGWAQESPGENKRKEVELGSRRDQEKGSGAGLQERSREGRWSWAQGEIKRREVELGSRRDQEKGGGAGLRERSRAGRWSWALGEIKSRQVELGSQESPGEFKRRQVEVELCSQEVELGPHSWTTVAFLGTVIVTLFRTAIETAISGVYLWPRTGERLNRVKI